jgi:chemotaxis protein CheD
MRNEILRINDLCVTEQPVIYTCFGLGSCIALFIADRSSSITGGVHIPLPDTISPGEFLSAARLIETLLANFEKLGSNLCLLRAKIAGGAQVYESAINLGQQNIDSVIAHLTERKIFLAAADVGGKLARTARFNSVTGTLSIFTSEQKNYII